MRRLYPRFAKLYLEAKIEVGCIDTNEDVGRRFAPAFCQSPSQPQQARDMRKWFNDPHDGQRFGGLPLLTTGSGHLWSGNAFKYGVRNSRTNCTYQSRAEDITGCFTSNQSDLHRNVLAGQSTLG